MKYKGQYDPPKSNAGGIRCMDRGRNRGKWVAFVVSAENRIYYSEPGTYADARKALDKAMSVIGPVRVYL
jgi:hypothetical protein